MHSILLKINKRYVLIKFNEIQDIKKDFKFKKKGCQKFLKKPYFLLLFLIFLDLSSILNYLFVLI